MRLGMERCDGSSVRGRDRILRLQITKQLSVMGELLGDGKAAWPSPQFRRVRSESPRNRTGPFLPSSAMLMEMVSL
jgi:hypothetical protein